MKKIPEHWKAIRVGLLEHLPDGVQITYVNGNFCATDIMIGQALAKQGKLYRLGLSVKWCGRELVICSYPCSDDGVIHFEIGRDKNVRDYNIHRWKHGPIGYLADPRTIDDIIDLLKIWCDNVSSLLDH